MESTTSDAQTLKEYYMPEEYLGYWSSPPYGPISGFSSYELPNDYTKIKGFNRFHCETSNLVVSCYKYQPSVFVSDDWSFVSTSAAKGYFYDHSASWYTMRTQKIEYGDLVVDSAISLFTGLTAVFALLVTI